MTEHGNDEVVELFRYQTKRKRARRQLRTAFVVLFGYLALVLTLIILLANGACSTVGPYERERRLRVERHPNPSVLKSEPTDEEVLAKEKRVLRAKKPCQIRFEEGAPCVDLKGKERSG